MNICIDTHGFQNYFFKEADDLSNSGNNILWSNDEFEDLQGVLERL